MQLPLAYYRTLYAENFENPKSHPGPTQKTLVVRHNIKQDFTQDQCTFYTQIQVLGIIPIKSCLFMFMDSVKGRYATFILLHFVFPLFNKDNLTMSIIQLRHRY